jgi:tetratricopeptide (TPR) repeat protein
MRLVFLTALLFCGPLVSPAAESQKSSGAALPITAPSVEPQAVVPQPQAEAAAIKREAVAVANRLAQAYPGDALTYALLGSAYYNTGQSEEATRHLRKCLELNPGQADAYEILARVAYEKGQMEEAERLYRESLKRGPANPDLLNRLGQALMDMGRTEEAVRTFQQAAGLPRPAIESYYLLGQASLQSGNPAQAKESFRQAIALQPDHTQAFFGLYTACLRLGQTEEAGRHREQFQKLEAVDRRALTDRSAQQDTLTGLPLVRKTVARTLFGAGQIYRTHGQTEKAAELFRQAAALDADSPPYRAALEALYVQRNALAEGVSVFEQLAREQPENSLNYYFLGRLYMRLQQFEPSERAYRKVQELAPDWPEGYRVLADLYLRANRQPTQAHALAKKVVELEPSGPHYFLLAVACAKNKDRTGALEAAKQAVALSPGEKKYKDLLQQLQQPP